jgi:hypothetical protein
MTDKKVHSITDHRHLLEWLEERLLASEPKRPINSGLVETGFFILEEVKDSRCFQVDTDMWGERLDAIFSSMVDSTSAPFYPKSLIGFTSTVYGEVLEHGEITIEDTNRILIELLLYRERFLRIHRVGKRRYLESTPECVEKFGTAVRVRLPQPERWCRYIRVDEDGREHRMLPDVRGHAGEELSRNS